MKKVIVLLMLAMVVCVGCKTKFQTSLNANEAYAAEWAKMGEVSRYIGYSKTEQAHYVVFAKSTVESKDIFEGTAKGHTVYSYNKRISQMIFEQYRGLK